MTLMTITSSFGSGGEAIARRVSEQLGVELFDDRKLQERIRAQGISKDALEELDEKAPGLLDRLFTNKPSIYLDILGSVVYDIASHGQGVIIGHAAQHFLNDFHCAFHVMIHASAETRSNWLIQERNMSEEASMKLIDKMDMRYKEFIQYGFQRDWNDFSGYDLVINMDKISTDSAVKVISDMSTSDEVKECSLNALQEMELSSLQRKIDAAIIKRRLTYPFGTVNVEVTGKGKVHLTGLAYNSDIQKNIVSVVKDVPGVLEITSDISVMPNNAYD